MWPVKHFYLQRSNVYRIKSTRLTFQTPAVRTALANDQRRPHGVDTLPVLAPPPLHEVSGRTVAIGCATTSRGIDLKRLSIDSLLEKHVMFHRLLPSFCFTASKNYYYHFYLSYDHIDELYANPKYVKIFLQAFDHVLKTKCLHHGVIISVHLVEVPYTVAPSWAQNDAMMEAYLDNMEYYYRINDDTIMISRDWTDMYLEALAGKIGVAGPKHKGGNETILTYDFVHHTHLEIFGYYYPRLFTDVMADTWITRVYSPHYSSKLPEVTLKHTKEFGTRYKMTMTNQSDERYFREQRLGKAVLKRYIHSVNAPVQPSPGHVVSISLYGSSQTMTFGAIRQAQLMRVAYPGWSLRVYVPANGKNQVPDRILNKLQILGAEVFKVNNDVSQSLEQTQWRLLAAFDKSVKVLLVRDAHRHVTVRESRAVKEWLNTNWYFHCVRDLEVHRGKPMVDGLWGAKLDTPSMRTIVTSVLTAQSQNAVETEVLETSLFNKASGNILYFDGDKTLTGNNIRHLEPMNHRTEFPIGQMFSEHGVPYSSLDDLDQRMKSFTDSLSGISKK